METMKAVRVHEYGGPEVLKYENAPRPRPVAGEVLVRIHAAGVNPVDWKVRAGQLKHVIAYPMPMIPGWDVSGVVEATGPNVTRLKKGDEVYGQPDVVRNGTYAEFTVVPESELALKPTSIDHVHAASVPIAALTAWQGLFDVGGLRTAVADGRSGLLVDGHDPAIYAESVRQIVATPALRDRLARSAIVHAARFGWDATADQMLDVYLDALDEHATVRRIVAAR